MQMNPLYSWMCVCAGVVTGGLIIKYIGFTNSLWNDKDVTQFYTTYGYCQGGITVTMLTAAALKASETLESVLEWLYSYPRTAFFISSLAMYKFYPSVVTSNWNFWKKLFLLVPFCQIPSVYFSMYSIEILHRCYTYSAIWTALLFIIGSIIPVENRLLNDFGLRLSFLGLIYFVCASIIKFIFSNVLDNQLANSPFRVSCILCFTGLFIDEVQHIKLYLEDQNMTFFNSLRRSLPLYLESLLIFKCFASLCNETLSTAEAELSIVDTFF